MKKIKKYYFIKFLFLLVLTAGIILYSSSFPATMKLLDSNVEKIINLSGNEIEFDFFSDLSAFSDKIINNAKYLIEVIIYNFEKGKDNKQIPEILISCSAKFPSENGRITSYFGKREDPFSKNEDLHEGIDIAAESGSSITAAWPGKVLETGFDKIYGNYVILEHSEKFLTKYCHLSDITVKEESFVNAEEKIGEAGSTGRSTGSHLHFEIIVEGKKIDPMICFEL